jgi:hypothetical protein
MSKKKLSLFDTQLVCEMITASIILYVTEKFPNKQFDENEVADFVLEYFPQILELVTSQDKESDKDDNSD